MALGCVLCGHRQAPVPLVIYQVLLRSSALHSVAVVPLQLQGPEVVPTVALTRIDMIHRSNANREPAAAPVAPCLLLTQQDVLVLSVWYRGVYAGVNWDVGAALNQSVAAQVSGQPWRPDRPDGL